MVTAEGGQNMGRRSGEEQEREGRLTARGNPVDEGRHSRFCGYGRNIDYCNIIWTHLVVL